MKLLFKVYWVITCVILLERFAYSNEVVPTFLLIGDSHTVGTFGKSLDQYLREFEDEEEFARVVSVGSCGMSPSAYLKGYETPCGYSFTGIDGKRVYQTRAETPVIDDLLDLYLPSLTLIALGANQIHTAYEDPEGAIADIGELVDRVMNFGSDCLWVGPPDMRIDESEKYDFLIELIENRVTEKGCMFFDSSPDHLEYLNYDDISEEAEVEGDGIHYDHLGEKGREALRHWAEDVFRFVSALYFSVG